MARGKVYQGDEEVKLSITPLIDVTFLLLIFFMCAMKFKTLERKVAAYLPKDRGLAPTIERPEDLHPIDIELKRSKGTGVTTVILLGEVLGTDEAGFALLDQEVETRCKAILARGDELPPGNIHAWRWVPHEHVVQAIDALMVQGVTQIVFRGRELVKGAAHSGRGQ